MQTCCYAPHSSRGRSSHRPRGWGWLRLHRPRLGFLICKGNNNSDIMDCCKHRMRYGESVRIQLRAWCPLLLDLQAMISKLNIKA